MKPLSPSPIILPSHPPLSSSPLIPPSHSPFSSYFFCSPLPGMFTSIPQGLRWIEDCWIEDCPGPSGGFLREPPRGSPSKIPKGDPPGVSGGGPPGALLGRSPRGSSTGTPQGGPQEDPTGVSPRRIPIRILDCRQLVKDTGLLRFRIGFRRSEDVNVPAPRRWRF